MKGIMLQGTSSDVGKSFLVTALCAFFRKQGLKVTPFKSQNMSNNSYITFDHKEIGRAQGIQAEAAGIAATVYMNPILLKPRTDMTAEVILFGKSYHSFSGRDYRTEFYELGLKAIKQSLQELDKEYELVVIEGAGSPVEMNLNDRELVNMKVAELADVPVILVADIDRGGVFASIVGTLALLNEEEKKRVNGIIINKFRGDLSLFEDGVKWIEDYTGVSVLGVFPYIHNHMVDGEDSLSISSRFLGRDQQEIDLVVIKLPYISNYTDVEPFSYESDVSVRFVEHEDDFGHPDALILPGTRSTIADLHYLKSVGLDKKIKNYATNGGFIFGICGGYQIMSKSLVDEAGSDTGIIGNTVEGLSILPVNTTFSAIKKTIRNKGELHQGLGFQSMLIDGYEIHQGSTVRDEDALPFLGLEDGEKDGCWINDGRIIGTYFHHIFHHDQWRSAWLNRIREKKGIPNQEPIVVHDLKELQYDQLALYVEKHLNVAELSRIVKY
ncbi:cobyric acid synthase [Metabacillus herbersteinensis]|uniref:Cobyric acid synthase n=1 Tax=Metabacillus herbersteinensis TaxID=283816 RepID=A0ABV6GHZ3_9BACI